MKRKKMLSTAVAGMLVAAQVVMPAAAADHNGQLTTDIVTKEAVVRVQVPTKLVVSVDEFQLEGDGSQIGSTAFTIENYSSMAVKVETKSTVTMGADASLVAAKTDVTPDAGDATKGKAWLAVAAQTAQDSYGVADDAMGDLDNDDKNVTVFPVTAGSASGNVTQTFYLEKGTGDVTYTGIAAGGTAGTSGSAIVKSWPAPYSQYYEVSADNTITSDATLETALKTKKVYAMTTADVTAATDEEKAVSLAVTEVTDKSQFATLGNSVTYYSYTITGTTPVDLTSVTAPGEAKFYVYASHETVGEKTGFRYIGQLSEGKQGGWTKADFSSLVIDYAITGIPKSDFEEAKADCTYGLYDAPVAPSLITATPHRLTAGQAVEIEIDLGKGSKAATAPVSMKYVEGDDQEVSTMAGISYADGKITLSSAVVDNLRQLTGNTVTMKITMNDAAATELTFVMQK